MSARRMLEAMISGTHDPELLAELAKGKTIEHILPQTPTAEWKQAFDDEERARLTHDLGNLGLTQDNSSYGNEAFANDSAARRRARVAAAPPASIFWLAGGGR